VISSRNAITCKPISIIELCVEDQVVRMKNIISVGTHSWMTQLGRREIGLNLSKK